MKHDASGKRSGSAIWVLALGVIFLAAAGSALLINRSGSGGNIARIYQNGVMIREIDLAAVSAPYEFTITSDGGMNTISVRSGGICVSAADCSDNTCVKQGWLENGVTPIVCLPHELVIQLEEADDIVEENELDAVAG